MPTIRGNHRVGSVSRTAQTRPPGVPDVPVRALEREDWRPEEGDDLFLRKANFLPGLIPHSFQPSFFSISSRFSWVSGGFLERRIPRKNGEGTHRNIQAVKRREGKVLDAQHQKGTVFQVKQKRNERKL